MSIQYFSRTKTHNTLESLFEEVEIELDPIREFCAKETRGRDKTHGVEHMTKVKDNAKQIYFTEVQWKQERKVFIQPYRLAKFVYAVAILHDVNDHKYVVDGTEVETRMIKCLSSYFSVEDAHLIFRIIEHISFSKENKYRKACKVDTKTTPIFDLWEELLGGFGVYVRNIVSDADKIEAIGLDGLERCERFTIEMAVKKGVSVDRMDVLKNVVAHADDKLLLLKPKFIYTAGGLEIAKPKHLAMKKEVERLRKLVSNVMVDTSARKSSKIVVNYDPNHSYYEGQMYFDGLKQEEHIWNEIYKHIDDLNDIKVMVVNEHGKEKEAHISLIDGQYCMSLSESNLKGFLHQGENIIEIYINKILRVFYYSDIHLEKLDQGGLDEKWTLDSYLDNVLRIVPLESSDILVLAGNIGNIDHKYFKPFMDYVSEKWNHVVYVPGNHEFYSATKTFNEMQKNYHTFMDSYENVHYLYNGTWEHMGITFIGSPLWALPTKTPVKTIEFVREDFKNILVNRDTKLSLSDMHQLHLECVQFIKKELERGDSWKILVTHFPITMDRTIDPKFADSTYNDYFANDADRLNLNLENVTTCISGHTHYSHNYLGNDEVLYGSNQPGYPGELDTSNLGKVNSFGESFFELGYEFTNDI